MSITNAIASAAAGPGPSSGATQGNASLGKDEFLQLLMTQLAHQDPTAPQDSGEMIAQLAQFSSLEIAQNSNESMSNLLMAQTANNQTQTANLVGKDVNYMSDQIQLTKGTDAEMTFDFQGEATGVTVVIEDENGRAMRTIQMGEQQYGKTTFQWDGLDDRGLPVNEGAYTVRVTATDIDGEGVDVIQSARGRITGVSFENGYPELLLGEVRLLMGDVIDILEGEPIPDTSTPSRIPIPYLP
jgi:flagellar basal-body rod modification protein FlgD